ncbi:hypothetical protein BDZ89DRAFT_1056500 [Hymenopellis radicata]|nr:hypothetical protein BDZ89DRAFT_1056500 [Hymenopellis radicata]
MASMLAPAPANPSGRISQLLPTVKCSNCNNPVPLAELGEHICAPPPPVPALPKPGSSAQVGQRLRNLVSSPKPNSIPMPSSPGPSRVSSPQLSPHEHRSTPSVSSDRSRKTSVSSLSPHPLRSSPLARSDSNEPTSPRREAHSPTVSSPLRDRTLSTASSIDSRTRLSTASSGSSPSTARPSQPSPQPPTSPQPHPRSQPSPVSVIEPHIDTKTGGEAGMAGVGRRGFAAAAHAAVFLAPMHQHTGSTLQSRREHAPQTLDINAALQRNTHHLVRPPLSAGSGYSTPSPGPVSPQSQIPSPNALTPSQSLVADTSTSPVSPLGARLPFFDKIRNKLPGNVTPIDTTSVSTGSASRSRASSSASRVQHDIPVPPSPSSGSEYGLAYADSTDYEDDDDLDIDHASMKGKNAPPPLPLTASTPNHRSTPSQSSHTRLASTENGKGKERALVHQKSSPSVSSTSRDGDRSGRDRSNSSLIAQALDSLRPLSSSSNGSRYSRTTSVSSGAGLGVIASTSAVTMNGRLERAMETLLEDAEMSKGGSSRPSLSKSKSTGKQAYFERKEESNGLGVMSPSPANKSLPIRSNTVGVPYSPEAKAVKLPARARTERERSIEPSRKGSRRVKVCVRYGRWIQVDSGGILCERCWKNMYLPKCRRCDLPIEKQAVSSSDGQLKGKYHKDCFNCYTCQKPFPDKTFYVFDGKPFCGYHYHEANQSLCAAPFCGQPIEGPCAVSHSGARYHPAHLSCEFSGCDEKLDEYWEVDGRMLCQRHANWAGQINNEESKATKRVTRFIDLSGASELGLR